MNITSSSVLNPLRDGAHYLTICQIRRHVHNLSTYTGTKSKLPWICVKPKFSSELSQFGLNINYLNALRNIFNRNSILIKQTKNIDEIWRNEMYSWFHYITTKMISKHNKTIRKKLELCKKLKEEKNVKKQNFYNFLFATVLEWFKFEFYSEWEKKKQF